MSIGGFVYVLGMSHKTITRLITYEYDYEETGIDGVDYIKKIIQVPINLPVWEKSDLKKLAVYDLLSQIKRKYAILIEKYFNVIVNVVDNNPRELKRFINAFIIACDAFAKDKSTVSIEGLLILKIIRKSQPKFYSLYVNCPEFRKWVNYLLNFIHVALVSPSPKVLLTMGLEEDSDIIRWISYSIKTAKDGYKSERDILWDPMVREFTMMTTKYNMLTGKEWYTVIYRLQSIDWVFLGRTYEVLVNMHDWKVYDDVMDIVEDVSWEKMDKIYFNTEDS